MSDIHPKTPLEIVTDIWSKNLSSIDLAVCFMEELEKEQNLTDNWVETAKNYANGVDYR